MLRRIASIIIVSLFLLLLYPAHISIEAQGSSVEDPFDVRMAPHFESVVYTIQEPKYSTSCDSRGYWKISVGTPSLTVADSKLVFAAQSATKSRIVMSSIDNSAINQTRGYYQLAFKVNNVTTYSNISLYDTDGSDWINISVQSGKFYYDYMASSQSQGELYGTATIDTYYLLGFDLTTSSVTLSLYNSAGTLLADKYISDNQLIGGELDEIRVELSGSASSIFYLDYLYVLGSQDNPRSSSTVRTESLSPNTELSESRIDLDISTLTEDRTLREELFGLEWVTPKSKTNGTELITNMGLLPERYDRVNGKMLAEGWSNANDDIEYALKVYIADVESLSSIDDVHLIDYYIDYLQLKLSFDNDVVQNSIDACDNYLGAIIEGVADATGSSTSTSHVSSIVYTYSPLITDPLAGVKEDFVTGSNTNTVIDSTLASQILRGIGAFARDVGDAFSTKDELRLVTDAAREQAQLFYDSLNKTYTDALNRIDATYNDALAITNDWVKSTDEKYNQIREDFLNYISISQAQVQQLSSDYTDALDSAERQLSRYYSYTEQQFQATNSIISRLLLQNENLANTSASLNQYFAGQLARTNDVILNLTSTLANSLSSTQFFSNVLQDGKATEEPLTISGIFGNSTTRYLFYIIAGFVIFLTLLCVVLILRSKREARTTRR